MALPQTIDVTGGLCMPCHNKGLAEIQRQSSDAEQELLEKDAVVLTESPEEDLFLSNCAVHCEVDCCGFNAIEISEEQFRRAVEEIGLETATKALSEMKSQIARIGDHTGLVRFRDDFEQAFKIKQGYEQVCAVLGRVVHEQAGQPDSEPLSSFDELS